jgi:hypothetical protein
VSGDIVERLRSQHSDLRQGAYYSQREDSAWDATADAADEIERLRAERDAVEALHHLGARRIATAVLLPQGHDAICNECDKPWPCSTYVLLHHRGGPPWLTTS